MTDAEGQDIGVMVLSGEELAQRFQQAVHHHRAVEEQNEVMGVQMAALILRLPEGERELRFAKEELEAAGSQELVLMSQPIGEEIVVSLVSEEEAHQMQAAMHQEGAQA